MRSRRRTEDVEDELGFDYDPSVFTRGLDVLVPATVARWALEVTVRTDRSEYDRDEPVPFEVEIHNRLPLPVTLTIHGQRIWGWCVDGHLEGSDEPIYRPEGKRPLELRAGEQRTFRPTWDGRIQEHGERRRWRAVSPGDHELSAFVATDPPVTDSTTISIR